MLTRASVCVQTVLPTRDAPWQLCVGGAEEEAAHVKACQVFRQKRVHMENQDKKALEIGEYKGIWGDIR